VFDELLRQPGVVEEWELRSPFGFLAIHGGSLELGAAEVAAEAADRAGMSFPARADVSLKSPKRCARERRIGSLKSHLTGADACV
jgi:phage replication-related protein YjqB (UPF0714/DUF867 family)